MTDCSYPEQKADNSRRHNRFPREMTSEERLQKFSLLQMTCHYPDQGSASDWLKQSSLTAQPIRRTTQMGVRRHQYGISAVVPQTSFPGENVGCFFTLLFKEQMSVNLPSSVSPQFHPLLPIHCFPSRSSSLSPVRSPLNQAHCEREPASLQHWIPVHHPWWAKSQEHCWQLTRALAVGENVHCISNGGPLLVWAQTRR